MSQIPRRMIRKLIERDELNCQWCGMPWPELEGYPVVFHHRRNRGIGSSAHKLSELVTVCSSHNQDFEDGLRHEPVMRGFRIPRNDVVDSTTIPILDAAGAWWLLDDEGGKRRLP